MHRRQVPEHDCADTPADDSLRQLQQYVRAHDLSHAVDRYQDLREAYYRKLKTFPTFGRGWLRRVADVRKAAKAMTK